MNTSTLDRPSVAAALAICSQPSVRYLMVEETDSQVIIRGSVPSYYAKQVAQETARPLLRSRQLLNQVKVARSLDA